MNLRMYSVNDPITLIEFEDHVAEGIMHKHSNRVSNQDGLEITMKTV